jgi:hypothetical protein
MSQEEVRVEKGKEEVEERVVYNPHQDEEFQKLYGLVSKKVRQIIQNGRLTPDLIRPLLLIIVREIEDYKEGQYAFIDGATKKAYAMAITRRVFEDLHKSKQIDDETYEWVMLSLEFFGGALFDGIKAIYNSIVDVAVDISENGCGGCFGRNCKPKPKTKSRGRK